MQISVRTPFGVNSKESRYCEYICKYVNIEELYTQLYSCLLAYPVAAEAGPAGQRDVADVGRGRGGHGLVDHQRAVLEARAAGGLHLPELLQLLHHVHWAREQWVLKTRQRYCDIYLLELILVLCHLPLCLVLP